MIFTVFDRDPLATIAEGENNVLSYYYAKEDELGDPSNYGTELLEMLDNDGMPLGIEKRPPIYPDQVLPSILEHDTYLVGTSGPIRY